MTLTRIAIRNYQSLHEVDIEFGGMTVIVGPTSSGKSAFTRALRTFIANTRGTAFISHGEQSTVLQGSTDTGTTITLTRGRSSAHDAYLVTTGGEQQRYTKLGGSTPAEVSTAIGIDPKDPLTFAAQFDRPYLLADSPAEVARTFGELTNVSVIIAAARESKRQKASAAQTLKTRTEDAIALREDIPKFRTAIEQSNALIHSESAIEKARAIEEKIARLTQLTSTIEGAEHALAASVSTRPLPALTRLETMAARGQRARALVIAGKEAATARRDALVAVEQARAAEQAAEEQYTATLIEAHTCPTCGASTEHLHA